MHPIYRFGLLCFLLIACLPPIQAQNGPSMQEASALFQEEQYDEAADAYRQITEREPENGRAWYWLGRSLQQVEAYDAAIDALQQVEQLGSSPPIVQVTIAQTYALQGNSTQAFEWLDIAVQAGFANVPFLESDAAFEPMRGDARFATVLEQADQNARPCEYSEAHRQFDFWIGNWDVHNGQGQLVGTNRIEKMEQGCFLQESWTATSGNSGSSMNYYDPGAERWHQLWMAAGGSHTHYIGTFDEGEMHFEGIQTTLNGTTNHMRMTFTPLEDGRVRQYIESSLDEGATWTVAFDGYYTRQTQGGS